MPEVSEPDFVRFVSAPPPGPLRNSMVEEIDTLVGSLADVAIWKKYQREVINQNHNAKLKPIREATRIEVESLDARLSKELVQGVDELLHDAGQAGPIIAAWDSASWADWLTAVPALAPAEVRLGALTLTDGTTSRAIPALVEVPQRSLVIEARGKGKALAAQAIQSLMLRLLATIPPGKLRFTFIDPVGLGQNVAPFMHLKDDDEELVTHRAWTEASHIEQQLALLTEHMETVIQTYLRSEFATIEQYNEQAGEVREPYRILAAFDFPTNCSEAAANRLVSIATNGPRCGVCAIVLVDTDKPLPRGFSLGDLERVSTVIAWDEQAQRFVYQDDDFKDCLLELDTLPATELVQRIVKGVGAAAKDASRVQVPFAKIATPRERWWTGNTSPGLRVALGPRDARHAQYLELGSGTAVHSLLVGRTGSGKSTLLHTLITNAALTYSPQELELYLIDFKEGVEFQTYALHHLPHARVVAIESEREFGLSVLDGLDAELERRGRLFTQTAERHGKVSDLATYREKTGEVLPRILLLVDEFQRFFAEDDRLAARAVQVLDRLVKQGRGFGIHILLAAQTLRGAFGSSGLPSGTIDQMGVRIALQCTETDSRLILADDNGAARGLSRPGEAIYNAANGLVEGNNKFQVAWLPDEERDRYLAAVLALAAESRFRPARPQIIFQGNARADLARNEPLALLLAAPTRTAPSRAIPTWLGEPIAIKEPTAALFRRQSGSNLLLVGQDDDAAGGMLASALIGLGAQQPADRARFFILDFTPPDAPTVGLLARVAALLLHPVQVAGRRELPAVIARLNDEVNRRMAADSRDEPAIYLLIAGLQRARDLRRDEDFGMAFSPSSFSLDAPAEPPPPSPGKLFPTILREGPDVGVHTLAWCDTFANLERTLDRRVLREFDMRVVLQMAAQDSTALIDTPLAGALGNNRAYYYSEEQGLLEKFRPYGPPAPEWLATVVRQLAEHARGAAPSERREAGD